MIIQWNPYLVFLDTGSNRPEKGHEVGTLIGLKMSKNILRNWILLIYFDTKYEQKKNSKNFCLQNELKNFSVYKIKILYMQEILTQFIQYLPL